MTSASPLLDAALDGFRESLRRGRAAHAYLVLGHPRGAALRLSERMLQLLFCASATAPCGACPACRQVRERAHADALWVEPESKSRQIAIEVIREAVLPRLLQSSYAGGWKALVVQYADRLTEAAANAFLKTLEEPPPKTLILLLTDRPEHLLPTIRSRCQVLRAGSAEDVLPAAWRDRVLEALAAAGGEGPIARLAAAARLKALMDEMRKEAAKEAEAETESAEESATAAEADADVRKARVSAKEREWRGGLLDIVIRWQRDLLLLALGQDGPLHFAERRRDLERQARELDYAAALRRVRLAEDMGRQFERNLSDEIVFRGFFRACPTGGR